MGYNYNFALGSVLFLGLTAAFYLQQSRRHDLQDRLYTVMLFGGLAAVTFDFIAAAIEPGALALPLWLLYAVNMLFVLGEHVCLPAFFVYSLVTAQRYNRLNKAARLVTLLPFFIIVGLLVLSPFGTDGIFYIDAQHIYRPGATHWMLYAVSGLYMVGSCVILARNYRAISRVRRVLIISFGMLILCAMLVQVYYPRYLLITSAAALGLTAMYYVLRAPGEQVDPLTGAFCRTVLPAVLRDLREKKKACTLVLYPVQNYNEIVRTHGPQLSDGLLAALSEWLRAEFADDAVVFMNDAAFTVVTDRVLNDETLRALGRSAPVALLVENSEIPVELGLAALVPREDSPVETTLATLDFLLWQMPDARGEDVLIADDAFIEKCKRLNRLEASMERIIREGTPVLLLESVRRADAPLDSAPAVLDVSLRIQHEALYDVEPDELLYAIRQSGNIRWYYERLIELTGMRARETGSGVRFCLPLFSAVLILDGMADRLFDLVANAGLDPRRVVLRVLEADISGGLPVVTDNIRRLAAFGFGLRLDGFAEGYTDMSLLSALPIGAIMIDKSLLVHATASERSRALLGCVVRILKETGKEVVCAGVDTFEDAENARAAGAPLLHGAWCAG